MKEKQINYSSVAMFFPVIEKISKVSILGIRNQMAHFSNSFPSANNKHDLFKLEGE